jgi:23S rRNA (cytosine1962-C5)-methyltransferase
MYLLIDSGNQKKFERFGKFTLIRPCSQALWKPELSEEEWNRADASFSRDDGNTWSLEKKLPSSWIVEWKGLRFKVSPTDFGHLGIFPEHAHIWTWAAERIREAGRPISVLNLFAYSGGATLACAQAGAQVCHLDASKGMVSWARENAELNGMEKLPIRWIVDDAVKFLKREMTRGRRYDGVILDPPTFGRGNRGETFKIERDLAELLELCRSLLSDQPLFVALTTHTPGMTPIVMEHLMQQMMEPVAKLHGRGQVEAGEMVIPGPRLLPSGSFARWK